MMTTATPDPLARALLDPECYPDRPSAVELQETHISWVFLAGTYAYKVKKTVALPFLDFSTLEARHHFCCEELRLNRRFAPEIYLDVVAIRGSRGAPRIGGAGPVVDYALRMRCFPQENLASSLIACGELTVELVTDFAEYLARLHRSFAPAPPDTDYGTPESVLRNALANFSEIGAMLGTGDDADALSALRAWTEREFLGRCCAFRARRAAGMVRECHGDLHLGNIVAIDGALVPFDCIEFNPALRWNDVMSEVAFLVMDLLDRKAAHLAWAFTNAYLEATGAYCDLEVLRFYTVYRAMVRAKIHLLRARQPGLARDEASRLMRAYRGYVALAGLCTRLGKPLLVLMHGLSGSGKSTLAAELGTQLGAIRIRSDVERKRLQGLPPLARTGSAIGSGLYDASATEATYERLAEAARAVAHAGYTAIVDAAFLRRSQRARLIEVARGLGVAIAAVDVRAPEALLRSRILSRFRDPSEATVEILEHQMASAEPISCAERLPIVAADTTTGATTALARLVAAELEALQRSGSPAGPVCAS